METDQLDAARQRLLANAAGVAAAGQAAQEQLRLFSEAAAVVQRAMALARGALGDLEKGSCDLSCWLEIPPMFEQGARQIRAVDLRGVFSPMRRDVQALAHDADHQAFLFETTARAISAGQTKVVGVKCHLIARSARRISATLKRLEADVIEGTRGISEQTERMANQAARMQPGSANRKGG